MRQLRHLQQRLAALEQQAAARRADPAWLARIAPPTDPQHTRQVLKILLASGDPSVAALRAMVEAGAYVKVSH